MEQTSHYLVDGINIIYCHAQFSCFFVFFFVIWNIKIWTFDFLIDDTCYNKFNYT